MLAHISAGLKHMPARVKERFAIFFEVMCVLLAAAGGFSLAAAVEGHPHDRGSLAAAGGSAVAFGLVFGVLGAWLWRRAKLDNPPG